MKVTLWDFDIENSVDKLWVAARTCYSNKTPQELMEEAKTVELGDKVKLIKEILEKGHLSIIEQLDFTFLVSGVSRVVSHQFMRHRHQSPAQQSQRYCKVDGDFQYIVPASIRKNKEALEGYKILMKAIADAYNVFLNFGIPAEDARYVLPNATSTNFTVTMNGRQFIHICHERMCLKAQLEIRALVSEMAACVIDQLPFMQKYLVPKCEYLGYCTEGKRGCGRKDLKENIIK